MTLYSPSHVTTPAVDKILKVDVPDKKRKVDLYHGSLGAYPSVDSVDYL